MTQGEMQNSDPTLMKDMSANVDPYHLSAERFSELQENLVAHVDELSDQQTIHAVWLSQDSPYANLIRTLEVSDFENNMAELMGSYEEQSTFLALVDNRPDARRIVHAFRLTSANLTGMEVPEDSTGVALLDDLANSGQLTTGEIKGYYAGRGVDLRRCIGVESNFTVGEKVPSGIEGIKVSDLGYLAIFRTETERLGAQEGNAAVFAHLNPPAIASLTKTGAEYENIAGRGDLQTPTIREGERGFDEKYHPVAIMATRHNMEVFHALMPFAPPEVSLSST